ncbi:MAG: hypothetical protein ACRDQH_13680 [Pseudonocardiaceae bacterium]
MHKTHRPETSLTLPELRGMLDELVGGPLGEESMWVAYVRRRIAALEGADAGSPPQ